MILTAGIVCVVLGVALLAASIFHPEKENNHYER